MLIPKCLLMSSPSRFALFMTEPRLLLYYDSVDCEERQERLHRFLEQDVLRGIQIHKFCCS